MVRISRRVGETLTGTGEGVCKVRTVRRKGSEGERWSWEVFNNMKGVPCAQAQANIIFLRVNETIVDPPEVRPPEREPKRPAITRKDVEEWG